MFSRRTCSITFLEIKGKLTSLSPSGYSSLLKSRAIFNFLQSAGTSSNYHGLLKTDMIGFTVTLASSLSIFYEITSYFPSDPLDLCMFSLFNCSLSCYLSSFQCSKPPHWFHGLWFLRANLSSKNQGRENIECLLILCHQVACCVQQQSHIL